MSSVHDRFAECEQRNGGHLEDVTSGMMCCVYFLFLFVLCYVSIPLTHLFLEMLKYVLPYKRNCVTKSSTFNFFNTLKSLDSLAEPIFFYLIEQHSKILLHTLQVLFENF